MTKSSDLPVSTALITVRHSETVAKKAPDSPLRLRIVGGALALLNAVALFLYLAPPGGTRADLEQQIVQTRRQIVAGRAQTAKMQLLASKVQSGSAQSGGFEAKYFLPKRTAYVAVFEEIQRMATASGIQERDAAWSEEPIEGTADLTLLNIQANYEGSYSNLMKFLHEADHSPMLLMLDRLQAAPQQKNNQINTQIRFQVVVREAPGPAGADQ